MAKYYHGILKYIRTCKYAYREAVRGKPLGSDAVIMMMDDVWDEEMCHHLFKKKYDAYLRYCEFMAKRAKTAK